MTGESELLRIARNAMKIAVDIIGSKSTGSVTTKGDRDVASEVDYEVEDQVRSYLARETPAFGFLGEERGESGTSEEEWILDPVDGTSNFVHGVPLFGVSLALMRDDVPTLGLIGLPPLNLFYSAELNTGAHCNGDRIKASSTEDLRHAIVSMGDFAVGDGAEEENADRLRLTARLVRRIERLRMVGSAATDLAWVAHGKLDATVIISNKPWDTAAGTLIAREAGAATIDRDGEPHSMRSASTIAVAPGLEALLAPLLPRDAE